MTRLGWIVAGLGAAQFFLYLTMAVTGGGPLFYFDPRLGLFALQSFFGPEPDGPGPLQWLSLLWQLGVGYALLTHRTSARVYLVGECFLAAPTVLLFVIVVVANMSAAHGFSVGELVFPLSVFLLFSVWPVTIGLRVARGVS